MYNVNDIVLYGSQGVCKISEIIQKDFNGKSIEYYILMPVYGDGTTIFIPTQNEVSTSKIRRVLSSDEIHDIIKTIPDEQSIWIENESKRKEKHKEIISQGNRTELVKLIKILYLHQQKQKDIGKKLHVADEQILKNAEKLLCDEFALVLNMKREQVLPFILDQVQAEVK